MRTRGLPIVDDQALRDRDRADGRALAVAQRLLDDGRVDEAEAALAPLAADPATPIRAHACLLQAGVLLMAGAPARALDVLARLPAAPGFPVDDGYRRMIEAAALRQVRRYDEALAAAEAAVAAGPTSGRLLMLADAQKHAGRVDAAAETLGLLLEREPRNATALAQLAGYENLRGDLDAGARAFASFRAVAAPDADAERNAAFYFATRGDLDEAVAALARALAVEPEATRAYIADEVELDRFRDAPAFRVLARGAGAG